MTTHAVHANRPPHADPADVPDRIDIAADEQEARYAPPTVTACPDCGTTEDHCLHPGCCIPCAERAQTCPALRHRHDVFGLHQRGKCGCGGAG